MGGQADILIDSGALDYSYRSGELWCEDVAVAGLAEQFGTPLYVYSRASMEHRFQRLRSAFGVDAHICFAVKSNPNLGLLRLFAELGAGFDLVSGGELRRLQRAGVATSGAVFAGVGKQEWEIRAAIEAGILFFILESDYEVDLFERCAGKSRLQVAVRLNPDVAADTHDYIRTGARGDKFGLDLDQAAEVINRIAASESLELVGYHVHLGSQLSDTAPYTAAFAKLEKFWGEDDRRTRGVRYYDLGGGFGVSYGSEGAAMDVDALAAAMLPLLARHGLTPILEPGRFLVSDAGILVTRVLGTKIGGDRRFALVDAAMNDLLRPALYSAEHPIAHVAERGGPQVHYDIVGPVCESGDFLARDRSLPELSRGDLLSVFSAGAYGSAMASNYNSRCRPAEVLVSGSEVSIIRRRETFDDLWATEVDL